MWTEHRGWMKQPARHGGRSNSGQWQSSESRLSKRCELRCMGD
ncbi:Asparagine synthetase [glutamine-hydrolyzing] 1 [Zea mays]|nr:Asparagine synthetase [glutamine-hydrolyzing] 1 [Zea mays]